MALSKITLHRRKFTWSCSPSNASTTLVKLDRVFCSMDWEEMFPGCLLQSAASDASHHCPHLLGMRDCSAIKRRFHLESFWPSLDGFLEVVETTWSSVHSRPCPVETLSLKLKATAKALQSWSKKRLDISLISLQKRSLIS